jgi:hypothetical protein
MPETHIPKLDDHEEAPAASPPPRGARPGRGKSLLKIGLEVLLISVGVFLGLAGEQWREDRRHHELAESSLRRLRTEIQTNRKAVAAVKDYHVKTLESLRAYFGKERKARSTTDVHIQGLQFVFFEETAWNLTLTTQALTYIDRDLAFALSRVYGEQKVVGELTRGMSQAMYVLSIPDNFDGFAAAAGTYYGDMVIMEPKLIEHYDELLPQIDRALDEQTGAQPGSNH